VESYSISERQIVELCDIIGKMLVTEIESPAVRTKIKRIVADYVNKRDIGDDPERLIKKLEWSVKVKFK